MQALPFYIPRIEMPQIDDVLSCLMWCADRGVNSRLLNRVPARTFRNHQHVLIDPARAARIPNSQLYAPILVASDGFVVDGNHRWALAVERGLLMDAWQLATEFGQAITLLSTYPAKRSEAGEV